MHIPVISTAHVPDSAALDRLRDDMPQVTIAGYDCGWFVRTAQIEFKDSHAWMAPIAKWAQANVYDWIRLDADGDVVEGLEVYDWEAGNGAALIDTVSNGQQLRAFSAAAGTSYAVNESISHGTHRTQDLIPRFLAALIPLAPSAQVVQYALSPYGYQDAVKGGDAHTWWESTDALVMLEDLTDALNRKAPQGFYFGAHPGDGSDFGFYEIEPE